MAHLIRTLTGADARLAATDAPPMGPGVRESDALDIETLEVWGSSFNDEGEDWCEFRAFRGETQVGTWRVQGY
jgi:hypothetical protein